MGGDFDGYALGDGETVARKLVELVGVIGEQSHALHAEVAQDLGADVVLACIGGESKRKIRVERVHALVLQLVGAQLVQKANAAALLAHVQNNATSLLFDLAHALARRLRRLRCHLR